MRSRPGLFFQSLGLTLLLLLPMIGVVLFLVGQREQQNALRQAAARQGSVAVETGAQNTHRILVAVQGETPSFLLLRLDGPARTVTFCGLPDRMLVDAPSGQTTLGDCYLTAGPARAAQLLSDTIGLEADAYFAATADCYAGFLEETATARLDTASLLDKETRIALGYGTETVAELTPETAEEWILQLSEMLPEPESASIRAAVWAAFFRQEPSRLTQLAQAARDNSARTLTDLLAQDLYTVEETLTYLAQQPTLTVQYLVPEGSESASGWQLDEEGTDLLRELLG